MRELTDHRVNPANDKLRIEVLDEPGAGGANHAYRITGMDWSTNPSRNAQTARLPVGVAVDKLGVTAADFILFQNGPIAEAGVNGVTQEALLAICIDRLRSFQAGPYACRENAIALTKMEEAQHWLLHRTRARMARGVEGTHKV